MLLDRAGGDIRALTRREQPARGGVRWIAGDLANKAALKRLVTGVEAVIHVAGVVNAPDAAGFEAGNVFGTLGVIEAAVAAGIIGVEGEFQRGDAIAIRNDAGTTLAHGLSEYDAIECARLMGRQSSEQAELLGYAPRSAVVHRDQLVLL